MHFSVENQDKFASVYINTYLTMIEDSDRKADVLKENRPVIP